MKGMFHCTGQLFVSFDLFTAVGLDSSMHCALWQSDRLAKIKYAMGGSLLLGRSGSKPARAGLVLGGV